MQHDVGPTSLYLCVKLNYQVPNQPRSQGPPPTSKKYPGYGLSRVSACQPMPHRGWVLDLILSLMAGVMNVVLLYRRYFESEGSYLKEILPEQCFVST